MSSSERKLYRPALEKLKPYITGKPIDEVKREFGLDRVIKLASNENPLGPSPLALEAVRDQLADIHRYPDAAGHLLRKRLSVQLDVSMDHLLLGNGSVEIVQQITETYVDPGDEVVVGWPAFFKYVIATQIMGGEPVRVPLADMRYDLPGLARTIGPRTRLVFIANPNNPTGTMVTSDEVSAFMKSVPEDTIVIFDEAYIEYIDRDDFPDTLAYVREGRNVIVLRTFSKIHGLAALRIGYAVAKPDIILSVNRVREAFNTNSLAQAAALHALDDTGHITRSKNHNKREMTRLAGKLEALGLGITPSVTNFILADMGRDALEVFRELLAMGVIIRPMAMYDLPNHMRITVGLEEENDRLLEALAATTCQRT